MRKIMMVLLIFVFLCSAMPLGSAEWYRYDYNDELYFEYFITEDGDAEIMFLQKSTKDSIPMVIEPIDLVIPREMDGHQVVSIAFHGINGERIYRYSIQTITIPETVIWLDDHLGPFRGCYSLKEFIVSPGNPIYEAIDGVLFNKMTKTLVRYPGGKTDEVYEIPEGTKEIAPGAFTNLKAKRIVVPASVTSLDYANFQRTVEEIQVSDENTAYSSIDGVLFDKEGKTLLYVPAGRVGEEYAIPEGVTSIAESAFSRYSSIRCISLPSSFEFSNGPEKDAYFFALALTEEAMDSMSSMVNVKIRKKLESSYTLVNPKQYKTSQNADYLEAMFPALKEGVPLWIEKNTIRGEAIPEKTKKNIAEYFASANITVENVGNSEIFSASGNVWRDEYPYTVLCQQLDAKKWPAGMILRVEENSLAYHWAIQNGIQYEINQK